MLESGGWLDDILEMRGSSSMRWTGAITSMIGFILVVDLRLLCLAWRCPIGVANMLCKCLRSCLVVKAGNVVMKPVAIAFASVDNVGENKLAV